MDTKEMRETLAQKLGIKEISLFRIVEYINSSEQAITAAQELKGFILGSDENPNPDFYQIGLNYLKSSYNRLCDKFPNIEEEVNPRYRINYRFKK